VSVVGDGRRCGVVGHPIEHSLSPALYRAAYAELGLDWTFDTVDVLDGGLSSFVAGLDASWRGLAVTMPHKAAAAKLGRPDRAVRRLGVGNTLVFDEDGPRVHNTDVAGFVQALEYRRLADIGDALVLGAGATARAALMALSHLGASRVTAQVRDPQRAGEWLRLADDLGVLAAVEPLGTPRETDMLVSTLPAHAADAYVEALITGAQAVFDASYDPWPTALTQAAVAADLPVVSGLDLLAGQAVQQIDLMVGDSVDIATLLRAGQDELRARMA